MDNYNEYYSIKWKNIHSLLYARHDIMINGHTRKMLKRNVIKTMSAPRPRISEREATTHHGQSLKLHLIWTSQSIEIDIHVNQKKDGHFNLIATLKCKQMLSHQMD